VRSDYFIFKNNGNYFLYIDSDVRFFKINKDFYQHLESNLYEAYKQLDINRLVNMTMKKE